MTQAEIDAKMKITRLKNETAANEERLRQSQAELEKFSAAIRAVCDKEIQLLTELPQRPVELPGEEAEEDSPVQEIEDHVMAAFNAEPAAAEQDASGTAEPAAEAVEEPAVQADAAAETGDPFADFPDLSATRQINLDELKFGRNYNS